VEKETKFVGKKKEKKIGHKPLQQQCIQQTREFHCETTSKEPSSKQKRRKKEENL